MALHQQLQFFNPSVPFSTSIQGKLMDGMMVSVFGQVKADADRFQLDLQSGSDIALHFNPRYEGQSGFVVHNTYQNRNWGSEEHKNETPFPRGRMFVLQILITQESYKISTNGKPFSEYKHRMPFSSVDSICIGGTVELSLVAFQSLAPHHAAPPGSFMVPYKSIIRGGLQPGKVIVAQGIIDSQAKRIELNLHHKFGIAFHYNPRFDTNMVVRNTFEDGKWHVMEERSGPMPFKRGQPFLVTIFCSRDHYKRAEAQTVEEEEEEVTIGGMVLLSENSVPAALDMDISADELLITLKLAQIHCTMC